MASNSLLRCGSIGTACACKTSSATSTGPGTNMRDIMSPLQQGRPLRMITYNFIKLGGSPLRLFYNKRKHNQDSDEESRQGGNTRQILFDVGVIGIELSAGR